MLILSRKANQRIVVGHSLVITVTSIQGDRVRLGFEGPMDLPIHREEVQRRLDEESLREQRSAQPLTVAELCS